jgi:hypothetical protein
MFLILLNSTLTTATYVLLKIEETCLSEHKIKINKHVSVFRLAFGSSDSVLFSLLGRLSLY